MFIESFTLPIGRENEIIERVRFKLYGKTGELDNTYPCGIFGPMGLKTIRFGEITIFYGGNGSGKSTLLNIISTKLALNRISPHNSSPVFDMLHMLRKGSKEWNGIIKTKNISSW